MALIFLDTSALLKLYLPEKGRQWLQDFVANTQVVISELALFESVTVLRRRFLEQTLTQREAEAIVVQIKKDTANFTLVKLGGTEQLDKLQSTVFALPITLRIRALDGLHLVAAILTQQTANQLDPPEPVVFVSSDAQLLKVAQALGFNTANPEDYPAQ